MWYCRVSIARTRSIVSMVLRCGCIDRRSWVSIVDSRLRSMNAQRLALRRCARSLKVPLCICNCWRFGVARPSGRRAGKRKGRQYEWRPFRYATQGGQACLSTLCEKEGPRASARGLLLSATRSGACARRARPRGSPRAERTRGSSEPRGSACSR